MEERALQLRVRGRVQGVGFRWFVVQWARQLGVRGHTRNLPDGSVEVVAVGDAAGVDALIQRLHAGPPASRVESVERETLAHTPQVDGFEIHG